MKKHKKATITAIISDIRVLTSAIGHKPPFLPDELTDWILQESSRLAFATIKRRIASVAMHSLQNGLLSPSDALCVRDALANVPEKNKKLRHALGMEEINRIIDRIDTESLIGKRDKAILLFGFATGGRRRSEIANANWEDFLHNDTHNALFVLRSSKTAKEGETLTLPCVSSVVDAVYIWKKHAKLHKGALFRAVNRWGRIGERLSSWAIGEIVKKRCRAAGYNPVFFGAHSLRVGFVTYALDNGASIIDIQAMTGHKSENMVKHYYRSKDKWKGNKALKLMEGLLF